MPKLPMPNLCPECGCIVKDIKDNAGTINNFGCQRYYLYCASCDIFIVTRLCFEHHNAHPFAVKHIATDIYRFEHANDDRDFSSLSECDPNMSMLFN